MTRIMVGMKDHSQLKNFYKKTLQGRKRERKS